MMEGREGVMEKGRGRAEGGEVRREEGESDGGRYRNDSTRRG